MSDECTCNGCETFRRAALEAFDKRFGPETRAPLTESERKFIGMLLLIASLAKPKGAPEGGP